jgi:hypothetical protein
MNLDPIELTTKEQVECFLKAIEESEKVPKKEPTFKYKVLRGEELREFLKRVK